MRFAGIPSILIERGGMGDWNYEEVRSTLWKRRPEYSVSHGNLSGIEGFRTYYPLEVADVRYQDAEETGSGIRLKRS